MNKPAGSKLFKLKEWLLLPDAANHLSGVCGEEVTEADILLFALDGHLKLSVNFVNYAEVLCGKVVEYEDVEWEDKPEDIPDELIKKYNLPVDANGKLLPRLKSWRIDDKLFLNLGSEVTTIQGVWDLTMLGREWLEVKRKYQDIIGGPEVIFHHQDQHIRLHGVFVKRNEGEMYSVLESFDNIEFKVGSVAQLKKIRQHIVNNNIGEKEAEGLLNRYSEDRKKFVERAASCPQLENYYPANNLPQDSVLVVRTEALREFEQLIAEPHTPASTAPLHNDTNKSAQLRALNQASLLWSNADRDDKTTWTDTKDVVAFLVGKGFSKTLAVRGASIVRPDWAESGRIPKE
ncbi:MAG TPA: hypothetical protein VIF10_15545 [Methylobacter sp.]